MRSWDQPMIELCIFLFSFLQDLGKSFGTMLLFRFSFKQYYKTAIVIAFINCCSDFLWIDILGLPYFVSMAISFYLLIFLCWWLYRIRFSYAMLLGTAHSLIQSIDERIFTRATQYFGLFTDYVNDPRAMFVAMTWTGVTLILIFSILYRKGMGFVFMQEHLDLSKKMDRNLIRFSLFFSLIYNFSSYFYQTNISNLALVCLSFIEPIFAFVVLWLYQTKIQKEWSDYFKDKNALNYYV
jgi:hypothetical protein